MAAYLIPAALFIRELVGWTLIVSVALCCVFVTGGVLSLISDRPLFIHIRRWGARVALFFIVVSLFLMSVYLCIALYTTRCL